MNLDEQYMLRAIELAEKGLGKVQPNPMVGAVIVHNQEIIGEGYHEQYGKAHAEVNAINDVFSKHQNVEKLLKNSSLYVSLEPCSHHGKTPPCADLIIKHKIPRVVISNVDPFQSVNGKGIEKLRKAGVEVIVDVLKDKGYQLNKRFFTYHTLQRPYVILKWAESEDSYISIAENQRSNISGAEAKRLNHRWRAEEQSIMIGTKTAMVDDPFLTVREVEGRNPLRVIIDKDLKLSAELNIFNEEANTIVFNNKKTAIEGNVTFVEIDFYGLVPQFILYQLYLMEVQSIIIEGGAYTINEFINFNLWDEARIFKSKKSIHQGVKAPTLSGKLISKTDIGEDELLIYERI